MEDKVRQNIEQASNFSQDSFCLWVWGFFFLLWTVISIKLDIFIPGVFFAGVQSEIWNEGSLVYVRHKYMHYFAPQRKKELAGMLEYINSIVSFRILCRVAKSHYFQTIRQNFLSFLIAWMCTGLLHFTG